jgi:hypothetical protein
MNNTTEGRSELRRLDPTHDLLEGVRGNHADRDRLGQVVDCRTHVPVHLPDGVEDIPDLVDHQPTQVSTGECFMLRGCWSRHRTTEVPKPPIAGACILVYADTGGERVTVKAGIRRTPQSHRRPA